MDAGIINEKRVAFARYLNGVWRSMITRDDDYVNRTFDNIFRCLPNESPVCLFWYMMDRSSAVYQTGFGWSVPPEARDPNNQAQTDVLRNILTAFVSDACRPVFQELLTRNHDCTGLRYHEMATQNPDEEFFTFSKAQ
uniref:Uncharacterized protein n=2 Tax=Paramoeba aestuarina TaxID=180227 RepID=A0A7S4KQ18_9EUKA